VVQSILEKVALWSNEHMAEEAGEVFAELANVKHFHFQGNVQNPWTLLY